MFNHAYKEAFQSKLMAVNIAAAMAMCECVSLDVDGNGGDDDDCDGVMNVMLILWSSR